MAEKKRQCGTCRFFVESNSGGHGKCSHPKRDVELREMVLLRPNELGCRTKWGTSLWQDPADESDPFAPETPQQPTLPDPIPAPLQYDDEVTSVSIAGSKNTRPSFEDDVVDSGATGSGMGSWSDTVQEERRRLLMSGERDALAGARKRHMEKQAQQRELIPFAEEESGDQTSEEPKSGPAETDDSVAASKSDFPPDDYVEEERSTNKDEPIYDDELVDDGVRPGQHRSPRVRKLLRENKSPKNRKAMGLGTPSEMAVTSHNPDQRGQWNSVPSMTPGFELPLASEKESAPAPQLRVSASAAPMAMNLAPSRPVSQARELLTEDRLRDQRARRNIDVPMADDIEAGGTEVAPQPTVTNRPRLSQATPKSSPSVDRLKDSPLRGYHPAVKAAAARAEMTDSTERPRRTEQPLRQQAPTSQHRTSTRPFTSQWQTAPEPVEATPDVRTESPLRRRETPVEDVERRPNPQVQRTAKPVNVQREEEVVETRRAPQPRQYETVEAYEPRDVRQPNTRQAPRWQENPGYIPLQQVQQETPFVRATIAISPEVPRCCGTCSSFRPGGVEGRGSCGNAYAGPVQRVVHEDDLACQHTYGSFWIPADEEVWLDEHNEDYPPTPRVDAMLAKRRPRRTVVLPDLEELSS